MRLAGHETIARLNLARRTPPADLPRLAQRGPHGSILLPAYENAHDAGEGPGVRGIAIIYHWESRMPATDAAQLAYRNALRQRF